VFSVPLRSDKAHDVHGGMNFIRPVKDIEAMEIEVLIFHFCSTFSSYLLSV